jgi:DNA-binding NtrC family response regulator
MNADRPLRSPSKGRILVIDDDANFLEFVVVILSYDNTVTSASTGREGLRMVRGQTFDLVCTDYDLPDMNGLAFLQQLAEIGPGTSGLLITGADSYLKEQSGANYYVLLKPFQPERLLSLSEQLVRVAQRKRDAAAPPSARTIAGPNKK